MAEKIEIKTEIKHEVIPLHPNDVRLIKKYRTKYRFGEITIVIQDGIPQRIKKVIFNDDLQRD